MNSVFEDINILGRFCGPRDIKELTQAEIKNAAGKSQADVMVLFGGSIIAGGDVFAEAMQNQIAKTYIIVGGAGHTTQTLRNTVHALYADMETENESEAVIFNRYIKKKYGLSADYLETESTNCGNNITFLLKLLNEKYHLSYLDGFAADGGLLADYSAAYGEYVSVKKQLDALTADAGEKERRLDMLRYQVKEIENANVTPGEYDELGMKRAKPPFAADEVTVYGTSFDDLDRVQHAKMLTILKDAKATPALVSPGIENLDGREAMHFTDGVNDLFFVLRMTARSSDDAEQAFVFPKKGHVYDLRRGDYLGETDRVTAKVPLSGASVWAVCAAKAEGVEVDWIGADGGGRGPAVTTPRREDASGTVLCCASGTMGVPAGEDLVVGLRLKTDGGPAGKRVFNVKLFRPDGTTSFLFARNLSAPDGKASFRFRMAHNDPKGDWKLVVTDALTGVSSERKFTVR